MKCNLCGADDTKFCFYTKDRNNDSAKTHFRLVKCKKCDLVFLNPRPDKEEIKKFYPPWYHSRAEKRVVDIYQTEIWGIPWREAMLRKAEPILKYKKEGKILDIGCGDGSLLKFMNDLGWQVHGLDLQGGSSAYARDILGLKVSTGRLEEVDYPEEFFDIIILFHVLEHLHDPSIVLKKANLLLKKDGYLLIEVPNFNSFDSKIFRSRWVGISSPLHLYHFKPNSLKSMLQKCGYTPIEIGFIPEQTKYVAGFSESLRIVLSDFGLYPKRKEIVELNDEECNAKNNFLGHSAISSLHYVEHKIFKHISIVLNKIGLGSNLLTVAKKKSA